MMDENPARFLPKPAVLQRIIDQDVSGDAMASLVGRHAGDDPGAGEMLRRPALLLLLSPASARTPGQDDWIKVPHRLEQLLCVLHKRQARVELRRSSQGLPE